VASPGSTAIKRTEITGANTDLPPNAIRLIVQNPELYPEHTKGGAKGSSAPTPETSLFEKGLFFYLGEGGKDSIFNMSITHELNYERSGEEGSNSIVFEGKQFKGYGGRTIRFSSPLIKMNSLGRNAPREDDTYTSPSGKIHALKVLASATTAIRPIRIVAQDPPLIRTKKLPLGRTVGLSVKEQKYVYPPASRVPMVIFSIGESANAFRIPNCVVTSVNVTYIRWDEYFTRVAVVHVVLQEIVQTAQIGSWIPDSSGPAEDVYESGELVKWWKALGGSIWDLERGKLKEQAEYRRAIRQAKGQKLNAIGFDKSEGLAPTVFRRLYTGDA